MITRIESPLPSLTEILALDHPSNGGAHHEYAITEKKEGAADAPADPTFAMIRFQKGPVKEDGVNGCQNEDLMAIVLDRLRDFQANFPCAENADAIHHLERALMALQQRTQRRQRQGTEGTSARDPEPQNPRPPRPRF